MYGSCRARDPRGGIRISSPAGFTLLEIMIVVVIMIGMAGLVLPLALADSKRAAFREAREQLEAMMLSARADAQRGGRTVRVMAMRTDDGGRWALREEEIVGAANLSTGPERDGHRSAPRVIQTMVLPPGIRIARSEDEAWGVVGVVGDETGESEWSDAEADPSAAIDGLGQRIEMQIAVLLPDGQISASEPLFICSGGEGDVEVHVGRVVVNSWTGALIVTELQPPGSGDGEMGSGMDIEGGEAGIAE